MKTKQEVLDLFQKYEYGYLPPKPEEIKAEILSVDTDNFLAGKGNRENIKLTMKVNGNIVTFPFWFVYRRNEKNVKTMICINFRSDMPDRYVPMEEIIDMGWNIAAVNYNDITVDQGEYDKDWWAKEPKIDDNYLALKGDDPNTSAGKIMMWAWGAMRILDYLLTRPEVDAKNVGVCGHSRLGKTALVTGAFDERFAFVHSNCSGRCGANLFSYDNETSEHVSSIVKLAGYWFCKNFHNFVDNEDKITFDQDMLVSLIAPRAVSIGSAVEDLWAYPDGEFACLKKASVTWEKFGYPKTNFPEHASVGENYQSGKTAYFVRKGKHYFSREDWNRFLPFFDKNLNK